MKGGCTHLFHFRCSRPFWPPLSSPLLHSTRGGGREGGREGGASLLLRGRCAASEGEGQDRLFADGKKQTLGRNEGRGHLKKGRMEGRGKGGKEGRREGGKEGRREGGREGGGQCESCDGREGEREGGQDVPSTVSARAASVLLLRMRP